MRGRECWRGRALAFQVVSSSHGLKNTMPRATPNKDEECAAPDWVHIQTAGSVITATVRHRTCTLSRSTLAAAMAKNSKICSKIKLSETREKMRALRRLLPPTTAAMRSTLSPPSSLSVVLPPLAGRGLTSGRGLANGRELLISRGLLIGRGLATGRSLNDSVSDAIAEATLLLNDLVEDDDRTSDDFKDDLEELRAAYDVALESYERALNGCPDGSEEQAEVKKFFGLAIVGLRDKFEALEAEARAV